MLKIKWDLVLVLIFIKHNGLFGWTMSSSQLLQIDSPVDSFHNSWLSQEVIHDKIILKASFNSATKDMLLYEYICWYNCEIMLV